MTKAIYPNVAPFNAEISEWTYDDIGNRTQSILNGTPTAYTYFKNGTNPNNGQRLQTDGVNTYAYDLNGNNTTRTGFTFTWYKTNELTGISGSPAISYKYDYAGRRFRRTVGTTNYDYIYDGQNLIGQRTTGVQDFVFGPGIDEPLATKIGANIYYYSVDGLGSVALLTDTNGAAQNSYVYDAWGVTRSQSGSLANPFAYTSREANEAGMMYYRARYYNPNIGRFVSEDRLRYKAGPNFYPYVGNKPIRYVDPSGLSNINAISPPPVERPNEQCCNRQEIVMRMGRVLTQLSRFDAGLGPDGDYAAHIAQQWNCDESGWCVRWGQQEFLVPTKESTGFSDACVLYCAIYHEWYHFVVPDRWNKYWPPVAIDIVSERPAYEVEYDCLLMFL